MPQSHKLGNMPLDENVQAEMYKAGMFLPSNNLFMRLLFRFLSITAVGFILSDYVSDFYVAGMFSIANCISYSVFFESRVFAPISDPLGPHGAPWRCSRKVTYQLASSDHIVYNIFGTDLYLI